MLARIGWTAYDLAVENADLWTAIGMALKAARLRQGFASERDFWLEHRTPSVNTIKEIEAGRVGNTDSLDTYADKLGINLGHVITSEVAKVDGAPRTLSADAYFVGLMYESGAEKSAKLTHAIWGIAELIAVALEARESSTTPRDGIPPKAPRTKRRDLASGQRSNGGR